MQILGHWGCRGGLGGFNNNNNGGSSTSSSNHQSAFSMVDCIRKIFIAATHSIPPIPILSESLLMHAQDMQLP
eukprot:4310010-Amphidinium_carterae.1